VKECRALRHPATDRRRAIEDWLWAALTFTGRRALAGHLAALEDIAAAARRAAVAVTAADGS
jgi:hypothetical protein